jgi:hypothetical protein
VNIDRFLVGCVGEMHSLLENARRKEKKRKGKGKEKDRRIDSLVHIKYRAGDTWY